MEALKFIRANRGIEFDPVVVDIMDKITFG
jgi:HD-GYP domain-containing protein (c-di-GMP phosphodiesterase class II)